MTSHEEMRRFAKNIRVEMLRAFGHLGFGHIGGAMSSADLLGVLYGGVMKVNPKDPAWEGRDYFVMSKGHSGPVLYAALALRGYFPVEELLTLNTNGTRLPSHPDRNRTPGVDMSTGSLAQGMSTAIGIAHGNLLQDKDNDTYLLLGDGECQEGQVWEGALYAPQHKLSHLIAFIDCNRQQLDGYTEDICDLGDLGRKFREFGWYALEVDGHDVAAIDHAISLAKAQKEKPSMIILNTIKGKGCDFAEGILYNHHMKFTKEQCDKAVEALLREGC